MQPGQRLGARLTEIGWTQLRLARLIGVDPSLLCRWIAGERTPTIEQAFAIERSAVAFPAASWVGLSGDAADDPVVRAG